MAYGYGQVTCSQRLKKSESDFFHFPNVASFASLRESSMSWKSRKVRKEE